MNQLLIDASYLLSETDPRRLEPSRGEVAFIGRSNVGKSSFLNALCRQKGLAKVSKTPGRTRAINVFAAGHHRWLVDLPGYGYASGPKSSRSGWPAMVEGYLTSRAALRCVFLLIDSKVGPTPLDHQMIAWLDSHALPYRIIANKIDQVKPSQRFAHQQKITHLLPQPPIWISATEGTGMPALRQIVINLLEADPVSGHDTSSR